MLSPKLLVADLKIIYQIYIKGFIEYRLYRIYSFELFKK